LIALLVSAAVIAGAIASTLLVRNPAPASRPLQYVIDHGHMAQARPALSPDGRMVAFVRDNAIYVRELARLEPGVVPGTEGGGVPFWSPDHSWLGFSAGGKLWKIRLDGSAKTLLCSVEISGFAGGAVWLSDGRIVFGTGTSGLFEVSERGGDPREILKPEGDEADFHNLSALPGGKGFLFVVHEGDRFDNITHWNGKERKVLLRLEGETVSAPVYSPTGHLLFTRFPRGRGLWAVAFSLDRLETVGEPFPAAPVGTDASVAGSTLVYHASLPVILSELVELDRAGRVVRTIGVPRRGLTPDLSLSPDGQQLAVPVVEGSGTDLWLYDMATGEATRLTFEGKPILGGPQWTPAGDEIVFTAADIPENLALRGVSLDRSRTRDLGPGIGPVAFSPDGKSLAYNRHSKGFNWDLWRKELGSVDPGEPLLTDRGWEMRPDISPDGRLMVYDKEGDILIRSFPGMGGPWQVATGGAWSPRWSPQGDRIFYLQGMDVMEVAIATTPAVRVGTPARLFTFEQAPEATDQRPRLTLGRDGGSFIMVRPLEVPPRVVVAHDWLTEVEPKR
jgi:hypothetical protein